MAFTLAQAQAIRQYLGYPTLFRYRNTRLESAITVTGDDAEASAAAVVILTALATTQTDFDSAFTSAGLKRADEVEWYQGAGGKGTAELDAQRARGRMYCSRLSQLLGVPLWGDYWGTLGFAGDGFMSPAMQNSSTGGMFGAG